MSASRAALSAVALLVASVVTPTGPSAQTGLSGTPWTAQHASRVRLVADHAKSANGHYYVGLEIVLADGWKTYWRMPGDSGVPPSFDWTGSANVAGAKVLYPAPMRMPEAGGVAIGYKQSVLLPIEITPQDSSKPVALQLTLEFGICREICIPATGKFELSIPVAAAGVPAPEMAAAIDRVPRPQHSRRKQDPDVKRIAVSHDGPSPKLVIEGIFAGDVSHAEVFVEAPEGLYVPVPKRVASDSIGVLRFETDLGRDLAQDLKGKTLTLTLVGETGATEAQWNFP